MKDYRRDPCPWRIVDDCGGAFAAGAIWGALREAIKGFRNAPAGMTHRMNSSMRAIKARAPITGGNCAIWAGLFSTIDCSLIQMRRKEDPWNAIISGVATGGILAVRRGPRVMLTSAVIVGVIVAMIEGADSMLNRSISHQFRLRPTDEQMQMMRRTQD